MKKSSHLEILNNFSITNKNQIITENNQIFGNYLLKLQEADVQLLPKIYQDIFKNAPLISHHDIELLLKQIDLNLKSNLPNLTRALLYCYRGRCLKLLNKKEALENYKMAETYFPTTSEYQSEQRELKDFIRSQESSLMTNILHNILFSNEASIFFKALALTAAGILIVLSVETANKNSSSFHL